MAYTTSYTAMNIAAEVVSQYHDRKTEITNLKLQKILYYTQMEYLQKYHEPLFDDDFEAWRHGPVIREVYEYFRKYIASGILVNDEAVKQNKLKNFPNEVMDIILDVVAKTLNVDAWDLVEKTHETAPWRDVFINGLNIVIPKAQIEYKGVVNI